jgi:hypothetical protein
MQSEDKTPSDEKTDNRAQNQGSDGADASDGLFANSMKNKAQKRYLTSRPRLVLSSITKLSDN